jgi:hypothetical protein
MDIQTRTQYIEATIHEWNKELPCSGYVLYLKKVALKPILFTMCLTSEVSDLRVEHIHLLIRWTIKKIRKTGMTDIEFTGFEISALEW